MRDVAISEVAQRAGVPASTLRFYEENGLIVSTGRRGLRRQFDPDVLERLALIALGRAAGFSLDEIGRMFAPDGQPRIDRQMLAAKADDWTRRSAGSPSSATRYGTPPPAPRRATWNAPPSAASSGPPRPAAVERAGSAETIPAEVIRDGDGYQRCAAHCLGDAGARCAAVPRRPERRRSDQSRPGNGDRPPPTRR
jgi:DNA-binding transcriptional MerR regulator